MSSPWISANGRNRTRKQNRAEQGTPATKSPSPWPLPPALLGSSHSEDVPVALLPFFAPSMSQGLGVTVKAAAPQGGRYAKMLMWLLMEAGISGDFFHSFAYLCFLIFYLEHIVPGSKGKKVTHISK